MTKILLLGGSSFVGRYLFKYLGPKKAIATYFRNPIENGIYFDALSMDLSRIIKEPNAISHAVILLGDTNPETCAADKEKSQALNVDSIKSILGQLKEKNIKPIFISTEFIFDGMKGNYTETDTPNPILTYGRQKLEIENYLHDNFKDFVILRLSKVFGSERRDGTIFSKWLEIIEQNANAAIPCADDQIFSPIYVDDVVVGIVGAIENNLSGIFHLASNKPFIRIELLNMLLSYLNEINPITIKVIPKSIHDFGLIEKRPQDVSMDPAKIVKAIKLNLSKIEIICKEIVDKTFQNVKI